MWNLYALYQGQWIDILKYCNNLSWSDDADTLAVSLSFDSILDLPEARTHLMLKKDSKTVFAGVIVNKANKDKSSSYTAMDYAFYLNKNDVMIQFNTNAKTAIETLCNKFGIKHNIITLNTAINKFYKDKKISEVIDDILTQCQNETGSIYIKEMQGDTLYIYNLDNLKLDCKYAMSNDFNITRSMEDMVNNVIVVSTEESDSRILENIKDDMNIGIFGQLTEMLTVDKENESQARNTAKNYLNQYNKTKKEMTVTLLDIENCEDIRANRKIYIPIQKYGMDGYYRVKSAQHTLANNNHKIAITVDFS